MVLDTRRLNNLCAVSLFDLYRIVHNLEPWGEGGMRFEVSGDTLRVLAGHVYVAMDEFALARASVKGSAGDFGFTITPGFARSLAIKLRKYRSTAHNDFVMIASSQRLTLSFNANPQDIFFLLPPNVKDRPSYQEKLELHATLIHDDPRCLSDYLARVDDVPWNTPRALRVSRINNFRSNPTLSDVVNKASHLVLSSYVTRRSHIVVRRGDWLTAILPSQVVEAKGYDEDDPFAPEAGRDLTDREKIELAERFATREI